jgi:hypothetical protein
MVSLGTEMIGVKPSPRILVWGIEPDHELGMFIRRVAPTCRFVRNESEIPSIRQAEWDAAIVYGEPPKDEPGHYLALHLWVLQFGGSHLLHYMKTNPMSFVAVGTSRQSVATEFIVPEAVPASIRKLVMKSLLPVLQSQPSNLVIMQNVMATGGLPLDVIRPFVMDGDYLPLAGSVNIHKREWWWLPDTTLDKNGWVVVALKEWSKSDPAKFPADPVWTERPEWQTKNERDAATRLQEFRDERERVFAEFELREKALSEEYDESHRDANRHERRLLMAQGKELVAEVQKALEDIGFEVQDVDAEQAPKGILLEDLRVEEPDDTDWISLAEVRGYGTGAKASDLQRIGRFVEHYIRTEQRAPSARWYIVNHNLDSDPAARPPVLAGSKEDVAIFAEAGGLVIDTRVLFVIRDAVRSGAVEPEVARQWLCKARGIMKWPPN